MSQIAKHMLAMVLALVITAATFHETVRVPAQPAPALTA